jgi:hypothetical protein
MEFPYIPLLLSLACLLAACEGESREGDDDDDGSGDADTDADADGDGDADADTDGCSEESQKVYVVDADESLYSFDPQSGGFELVGVIDCPGEGQPFSMAVSREGVAYVLYQGAFSCVGINAVDITDASCLGDVGFACGQSGFDTFGMGFATDSADTTDEKLYVGKSTTDGSTLAWIDTVTWTLTPIGPITSAPELTGNALGELWGFYAWITPPRVARIDKASGAESEVSTFPELSGNAAFAFAHWGGDYYLFHAPEGDTTVYKLSGGTLSTYVASTGLYIVGAGVSTCAPVTVE